VKRCDKKILKGNQMNKTKVYLGGKIDGLNWHDAFAWREIAERELTDAGILVYNSVVHVPAQMRGKTITREEVAKLNESSNFGDEIYFQDRFQFKICSIILFNLKFGSSIGTLWELGAASILDKLIIAFDIHPDLKLHPFIKNSINLEYETLEEALNYIIKL